MNGLNTSFRAHAGGNVNFTTFFLVDKENILVKISKIVKKSRPQPNEEETRREIERKTSMIKPKKNAFKYIKNGQKVSFILFENN